MSIGKHKHKGDLFYFTKLFTAHIGCFGAKSPAYFSPVAAPRVIG